MIPSTPQPLAWRKATKSGSNQGHCVEAGAIHGHVKVRDTKHHASGTLTIDSAEWSDIIDGIKHDDFGV